MSTVRPLNTTVSLRSLYCRDEEDGSGNAEPYAIITFFKIDGQMTGGRGTRLESNNKLSGSAQLLSTSARRGNLGDSDVDAGDTVNIPASVGSRTTTLQPILLRNGNLKVGGFMGCVWALMEDDGSYSSTIDHARNKWVERVQFGLDYIINDRLTRFHEAFSHVHFYLLEGYARLGLQEAGVANFSDDLIGVGSAVFHFAEFTGGTSLTFEKNYYEHGSWRIRGNASAVFPSSPSGFKKTSQLMEKSQVEFTDDNVEKKKNYI